MTAPSASARGDETPAASAQQVAVVIAAHNAAATLDRAVTSALAALETGEVCIVDDGSTDATLALARAWTERDGRVSVVSQPNGGPGAARNAAIAATSAPWIAVLDADDYIMPARFAALLAHADDADFLADALIRVRDDDAPAAATAQDFAPAPLSFEQFVLGNLGALRGPLDLGFLKPVMRRAFLDTHGLRYRDELRLGEDYEFYARALALGGRFLSGGPAGYVSVERDGSLSRRHSEEDLQRLRDCDQDLAQVRVLSPAEQRALRRHWVSVDCRLQWRKLISAVKRRDLGAAVATFHSPQASLYLAARLVEQAWLRGTSGLRARAP